MKEEHKVTTDEQHLKDLYDDLRDLIAECMESKRNIDDIDNWKIAHDLEFQLELAFEKLRRYLVKIEVEE